MQPERDVTTPRIYLGQRHDPLPVDYVALSSVIVITVDYVALSSVIVITSHMHTPRAHHPHVTRTLHAHYRRAGCCSRC